MPTTLTPASASAPGAPVFVVHSLGDWTRNEADTEALCVGGGVKEYARLEDVQNPVDRSQLEWMLEHGTRVTQCGNTVYQLRYH